MVDMKQAVQANGQAEVGLRAAIYCRVSTDRQKEEGESLTIQEDRCRQFAEQQGFVVAVVYTDSISAFSARPEYSRMLQDALDAKFEVVLIWRLDRFGRNIEEAPADYGRLEKLGIRVIDASSPHAGRLERNISFVLGDYYSYLLSGRVREALVERVNAGRWVSRPPLGYDLVPVPGVQAEGKRKPPKMLSPNEDLPKIAELFRLFETGHYSLNMLTKESDRLGLGTPHRDKITGDHYRNPFSRQNVYNVLNNPAYRGATRYGKWARGKFEGKHVRPESEWIVIEDTHEAAVSKESFQRVQDTLRTHKYHYGHLVASRHLLLGLVYCGVCEGKMRANSTWRRRGKYGQMDDRYYYTTWQCYRHFLRRDCTNTTYHGGKLLEEWVKAQLRRLPITDEDRTQAQVVFKQMMEEQSGGTIKRKRELLKAKEQHEADYKALAWDAVKGKIPESLWMEMKADKEKAIQEVDHELAQLDRNKGLERQVAEGLEFLGNVSWDALDLEGWREVLMLFVDRVVIEDRRTYRIEWKSEANTLLGESSDNTVH